jgi:hypothetical protein
MTGGTVVFLKSKGVGMRRYVSLLCLVGALAGAGCFTRVRIYDEPRRDYHRWNAGEDRAYREYLREQRREYRLFTALDRREQEEYWNWRHQHSDRDLDRARAQERGRDRDRR